MLERRHENTGWSSSHNASHDANHTGNWAHRSRQAESRGSEGAFRSGCTRTQRKRKRIQSRETQRQHGDSAERQHRTGANRKQRSRRQPRPNGRRAEAHQQHQRKHNHSWRAVASLRVRTAASALSRAPRRTAGSATQADAPLCKQTEHNAENTLSATVSTHLAAASSSGNGAHLPRKAPLQRPHRPPLHRCHRRSCSPQPQPRPQQPQQSQISIHQQHRCRRCD